MEVHAALTKSSIAELLLLLCCRTLARCHVKALQPDATCGCRLWDARSSRLLGTVKVGAGPLFLTWKRDGAEVACTDRSDTITVVDARTAKLVRTHKYSCQVRGSGTRVPFNI